MKKQPVIVQPIDLSQERDIEQRLQKARSEWNPLTLWILLMLILIVGGIILIYLYEKGILVL